jgi:hypothetical protein
MRLFSRKTRSEVIDDTVDDILFTITGSNFTNEEIATIINAIAEKGKLQLSLRVQHLSDELERTMQAAESIKFNIKKQTP